ncbi:hypothetical protein PG993_015121 [Apiospora rasikravindrae]|uniref:Uncharacterized protein n=1 Tax=Apiospora rasikravindrae TaxID=990691 RepID=A0ABR1RPY9_9PEZI
MLLITSQSILTVLLVATATRADPVTFSVGDLNAYNLPSASPKDGSVVVYSGTEEEGISVAFPSEIHDKINSVARPDCQTLNNKCFDSIRSVIKSNSVKDTRTLVPGASKALGPISDVVVIIVTGMHLYDKDYNPWGHLAPPKKLNSELASATEIAVVTEDGKPAVTITQNTAGPTTTGADSPLASVYTESKEGHEKGSVVITLPDNLAARADEIMARMIKCSTDEITGNKPSQRFQKARADDREVHDALCGARAIYTNGGVNGALAALDLVQLPRLNFRDGALAAAMNQFVAWARQGGAQIQLPAPQIDGFALLAFTLGLIRAAGNTLQRVNVLRETYLKADVPTITSMPTATRTDAKTTTAASSCSASSCTVSCSMRGAMQFCQTGCPCSGQAQPTLYSTVAFDPWAWPTSLPNDGPAKDCPGDLSEFPGNVFYKDKGVPAKFCAEVSKDTKKPLEWMVNSYGEQAKRLGARTPPPNPDTWKDYRITLMWNPREGENDVCSEDCTGAFDAFRGSECNPTGGFGQTMKLNATVDVECGRYSYQIQAPPKPPTKPSPPKAPMTVESVQCRDKPTSHHGDVSHGGQDRWAKWVCSDKNGWNGVKLKAGDKPLSWTPTQESRDALLTYKVSWVDGCVTDVDFQSVSEPVKGASCYQIFRDNYIKCKNTDPLYMFYLALQSFD